MKPIILQGHSRPIKDLKFNKDGDLLFSGSNDKLVTLWTSETGERIGTYTHSAALNSISVTQDSKLLITGDSTGGFYIWEINTGTLLKKIVAADPSLNLRSVDLSFGDQMCAFAYAGRAKDSQSQIDIYTIKDILSAKSNSEGIIKSCTPFKTINSSSSNFVNTKWMNLNKNILCSREDGMLQLFDFESGKLVMEKQIHEKTFMDLDLSKHEEVILTASKDGKSYVLDPKTFDTLTTLFPQDPSRNINSAKISPLFTMSDENEEKYHAVLGGGQDSKDVTTSHAKKGGFELLIYNIMYGDELGSIQAHFGPVNTLAFSPDGKLLASGAEDATIKVHKLEEEYFNLG